MPTPRQKVNNPIPTSSFKILTTKGGGNFGDGERGSVTAPLGVPDFLYIYIYIYIYIYQLLLRLGSLDFSVILHGFPRFL